MKQQFNTLNVSFLKRQAKTIKKQKGITHYEALHEIAQINGFRDWNHLLKNSLSAKPLRRDNNFDPYRNLLVAGLNQLLLRKAITLEPIYDPNINEKGYIFVQLFGYPSVILWRNIGYGELQISVWWKYEHKKHPQANLQGSKKEKFNHTLPLAKRKYFKDFVGVTASCWLERGKGKHMQGVKKKSITDVYTRKGELDALKKIPTQKPKGYEVSGPFYM